MRHKNRQKRPAMFLAVHFKKRLVEMEKIIAAAFQLRYRVFFLAAYSMGLRLEEALSLQVGDIDAGRRKVYIRRGKRCKDRLIPLPEITYSSLQALWRTYRHWRILLQNTNGSFEQCSANILPETYSPARPIFLPFPSLFLCGRDEKD